MDTNKNYFFSKGDDNTDLLIATLRILKKSPRVFDEEAKEMEQHYEGLLKNKGYKNQEEKQLIIDIIEELFFCNL